MRLHCEFSTPVARIDLDDYIRHLEISVGCYDEDALNEYIKHVGSGIFAVLNGLFKMDRIGRIPLFYTATILLLYSANDLSSGTSTVLERVLYNVIGIVIAIAAASAFSISMVTVCSGFSTLRKSAR